MQYLRALFMLVFVARLVVADNEEPGARSINERGPGTVVDRDGRILIQDNYYSIMSKLEQQQQKIAALETEMATLKAQQVTHPTRVAFKAHLSKDFNPTANQLIEFDDVQFNVGNAYHHGTFIAPVSGTYLFSVFICSGGNHYVYVDLLRNGNMIGQVVAGDTNYTSCASETTVTELTTGDDVIVKHQGSHGDRVLGNSAIHNSFTGVLLY